MNQNKNIPKNEHIEDEINLKEIFEILWAQKWFISKCIAVASVLAIIYSLSLPNKYTSNALLAPTQQLDGISGSMDAVSGIASLAGISLPSSTSGNMTEEAFKTLSSFAFFKNNVLPNIFLPDLIAAKSWDAGTNTIIYEDNIYDIENKKWRKASPSDQTAFTIYDEIFSKSRDIKTGFITISIKHRSPYVSKEWVDLIVLSINEQFRLDQKTKATLSIKYLNDQIAKTSLAEIKQGLSELIQKETEKLMLVEANKDFVYKFIDPPIVPEKKSEPQRAFICIFGFLMGAIIGIIYVFVRHYLRENNS